MARKQLHQCCATTFACGYVACDMPPATVSFCANPALHHVNVGKVVALTISAYPSILLFCCATHVAGRTRPGCMTLRAAAC
jgi:hypothetical protein